MPHSPVLYAMAHSRSAEAFGKTVTAENFNDFVIVWMATLEQMKQDFLNEGLTKTAEEVDKMIEFDKNINRTLKINDKPKPSPSDYPPGWVTGSTP
jgi:hypothetical protein